MNVEIYDKSVHYQQLIDWLVNGYNWKAGPPAEHLGSVGYVAVDKNVVVAMGFVGYMEDCKLACMTHMVGNPSTTARKRAVGILRIMLRIVSEVRDRYGEDAGIFATYSNRSVIRLAQEAGFKIAVGDGSTDYFLYQVFKDDNPMDYVND